MGLLDDAIHEHLELKRLRGADPGLVSREEQEAFGPAGDGEPADTQSAVENIQDDPARGEESTPAAADQAQAADFANIGQETAELDMRAVLEDEADHDGAPGAPAAAGPVRARPLTDSTPQEERDPGEDSLEWEMPGEDASQGASERHADESSGDPAAEGPVEDVLEETPDFLRDTPEQERLWFEQRPPRDFDFDK
jgi:hypothetical protein